MRRFFLCLAVLLGIAQNAGLAWAQGSTLVLPHTEGEAKKNYGELVFFPGVETRPSEDRHLVNSGQSVEVCIKLGEQVPAYLESLKKYAVGFRLILEDNQEPPHVLTVAWGDWLKWLRPDAQGCYSGQFQIPATAKSGLYQVADLLIATNDYNYYSLRDVLYDFSQVDELQIKNPSDDLEAPSLIAISTYNSQKGMLKMGGGVLRAKIQQIFAFKDEGSGIDKKSVRVFYQLRVDGDSKGFKEAKCKRRPQGDFMCTLELREPFFEWSLREVSFELSSIRLQDKAGNLTVLQDSALFAQKAAGSPICFDFTREGRWFVPGRKLLQEQKLF